MVRAAGPPLMIPDVARRLLEIDAHATREEVRRAYLRKAKVCKPERDPEGFRRLREAYEAALAGLEARAAIEPTSAMTIVTSSTPPADPGPPPRPATASDAAATATATATAAPAAAAAAAADADTAVADEPAPPIPPDPAPLVPIPPTDCEARLVAAEAGDLDVRALDVRALEDRALDRVEAAEYEAARRLLARLRAVLASHGAELDLIRHDAAIRHARVRSLLELAPKLTPPIAAAVAIYLRDGDGGVRARIEAPRGFWHAPRDAKAALATLRAEAPDLGEATAWYLADHAVEVERRYDRGRLLLLPATLLLLWVGYAIFSIGVALALGAGTSAVLRNLADVATALFSLAAIFGVIALVVWGGGALDRQIRRITPGGRFGLLHLVTLTFLVTLFVLAMIGQQPSPSPPASSFLPGPTRGVPVVAPPSGSSQELLRRAFPSDAFADAPPPSTTPPPSRDP